MSLTTGRYAFAQADTAVTPKGKITADTESATLADANETRVELIITNNGANAVYLALGDTAVAEEGIRLNKEGGSIMLSSYRGAVSVITKEGESLVTFSEV